MYIRLRTVRTNGLEEVPWLELADCREVVPWLVLTTDGCEVVPWLVLTDRTRATGGSTTLPSGCGNLTGKQVLKAGLAWSSDLSPRLGRCNLLDCSLASGLLIYWRIHLWSHIFFDLASRAATFTHRLSNDHGLYGLDLVKPHPVYQNYADDNAQVDLRPRELVIVYQSYWRTQWK